MKRGTEYIRSSVELFNNCNDPSKQVDNIPRINLFEKQNLSQVIRQSLDETHHVFVRHYLDLRRMRNRATTASSREFIIKTIII